MRFGRRTEISKARCGLSASGCMPTATWPWERWRDEFREPTRNVPGRFCPALHRSNGGANTATSDQSIPLRIVMKSVGVVNFASAPHSVELREVKHPEPGPD